MFLSKKHLPRRTFLRGMGVTLALPLLDSMVPAQTPLGRTAAKPSARVGFVYVPHGAIMDKWTPAVEGAAFEFTPILKRLENRREIERFALHGGRPLVHDRAVRNVDEPHASRRFRGSASERR